MSATQSTLGAAGVKFARDEVVGDADARHADRRACLACAATSPEIAAWRISRSTRLRPTRMPCARRSSAWMRRRAIDAAVGARGWP